EIFSWEESICIMNYFNDLLSEAGINNEVSNMIGQIKKQLIKLGVNAEAAIYLTNVIAIVGIALLSIVAHLITKKIVIKIVSHYIKSNKVKWDDYILERKVIQKLSHI